MRVAIEAGHGGKDSGAVGYGRLEKDDNLKLAKILNKEFTKSGFDVIMTRETDISMSYSEKCAKEKSAKCDIAIACHRNAFTDKNANGFEIWVHSKAGDDITKWAKDICDDVAKTDMKIRGNGVFKGFRGNSNQNYYWNSGTLSPSMLIEFGFITNYSDNINFDNNLEYYAQSIVKASCDFLNIPYKKEDKIYHVQIGAFKEKQNAQNYLKKLKANGYNSFIVEN